MESHQLVDKVVKLEQRFKKRGQTQVNYSVPSPNIRQTNTSETKFPTAPFSSKSRSDGANKNKFEIAKGSNQSKSNNHPPKGRIRDNRCFKCQDRDHIANQCLNQRRMVGLPNGDIVTDDEDEYEDMPALIEKNDNSGEECALEGQVGLELIAWRALTSQIKDKEL